MSKFSISGRCSFDFSIEVDAADLARADYILTNVMTPKDLTENWDNCEILPSVIEEIRNSDSIEVVVDG